MIKKLLAATVMTALLCSTARADYCDGAINIVAVQNDGSLFIRHGGKGYWLLCNVTQSGMFGGVEVTAPACRSWQAILTAAQKTGTSVRLYRRATNLCTDLGSWVEASVYFVEDLG